jgi:Flp pilus assembly pilin Flp
MNLRSESGQGLTEYLILVVLISLVSIAASKTLGSTIKRKIELTQRHIERDVGIDE